MINKMNNINQSRPETNVNSTKPRKNEISHREKIKEENKLRENELSAENLREELEEKVEDLNNITDTIEENLSFKLHDATERLMVQVIDIKTKEVIKEMPPEEMLDLAAKIHEMVGILIDEKV